MVMHVLALDAADPTPDTAVLIAQHPYFRLDASTADAIVEAVRAAVRSWSDVAKRLGAKDQEISIMEAVIDPDRQAVPDPLARAMFDKRQRRMPSYRLQPKRNRATTRSRPIGCDESGHVLCGVVKMLSGVDDSVDTVIDRIPTRKRHRLGPIRSS